MKNPGVDMKNFISWAVILAAFIVCLVECIYGDPTRLITYSIIFLFMWGATWALKKMSQKEP